VAGPASRVSAADPGRRQRGAARRVAPRHLIRRSRCPPCSPLHPRHRERRPTSPPRLRARRSGNVARHRDSDSPHRRHRTA
jgi:hypothetical protein